MYGGRAGAGAGGRRQPLGDEGPQRHRRWLAVKAVEEITAALIWNVEDELMQGRPPSGPRVHKEINRTP